MNYAVLRRRFGLSALLSYIRELAEKGIERAKKMEETSKKMLRRFFGQTTYCRLWELGVSSTLKLDGSGIKRNVFGIGWQPRELDFEHLERQKRGEELNFGTI
ncbi:hypothetical protein B9Z55_005557 [Caenorhabditis nigoni]|uniref:Uncharacterized protein n=1 Tax=Caenorhabditis nigoni TaxID=1611254 RepID=A0A2G5V1B9_9PELO|nr:hypothetical protein B9Z55_005557 [Caenorhabditis nigoni]